MSIELVSICCPEQPRKLLGFFAQMHVPVKTRFYSFAVNYWYHYFSSRKPATLFFLLLPRRSVKFADFIILVHQNMWFQVKSNLIQDICLTLTENKCNVQKAIFYSRKHNVENEREKKCIQNAPMKMWRFFFFNFLYVDTIHILTGHARKKIPATKYNDYIVVIYTGQ